MATNERLRGSIASAGLRPADLAEAVGVDAKTVERWITKGRMPHRMHRLAVAHRLDVDEVYLWPDVLTAPATQSASAAELLELHPSRSAVPADLWRQLIVSTREALDVLVYAGTFLFEQHDLIWRAVCQVGMVKRCPRPSPWTPLRLAGWRGGDVRVGVDASSV